MSLKLNLLPSLHWNEDDGGDRESAIATLFYKDRPSVPKLLASLRGLRDKGIKYCLVRLDEPIEECLVWYKCLQHEAHLQECLQVEGIEFFVENAPSQEGLGSQLSIHRMCEKSDLRPCFNVWHAWNARENIISEARNSSEEGMHRVFLDLFEGFENTLLRPVPTGLLLKDTPERFRTLVNAAIKAAEIASMPVLMCEENWKYYEQQYR